MPLAQPIFRRTLPASDTTSHLLWIIPDAKSLPPSLPARAQWLATLARREVKIDELGKSPQAIDLPHGGRMALVMEAPTASRFERLTALRNAAALLLEDTPEEIDLVVEGSLAAAQDAYYVLALNGEPLPVQKKKAPRALKKLRYFGPGQPADFTAPAALARANTLTRSLSVLPPNVLTPADYRRRLRSLAKQHGWAIEEFDFKRLQRMGAGAFCAVAQGSDHTDAAIVRLRYRPRGAQHCIALVGKGICFDTGGHNLKPARYMQGMHEDMNGSAVVLGILQAASELRLPVALDVWLAIAHNHLSPGAFKQNDIVRALDGTTIEIVHTDAEGRMVLADTLTLASREKPDLIVDFATLTGTMLSALGTRYSGIFASNDALAAEALAAGRASGERVCAFPLDEDYEKALESKVADVKQCTLDGDADHILAARFLQRFTNQRPWLHVDLSAASCEGGLGAVATPTTGFGVAFGLHLLSQRSA